MKDKAIEVGDLVCVVKGAGCCGQTVALGLTFKVVGFNSASRCQMCGNVSYGRNAIGPVDKRDGRAWAIQLYRLIKIDPPSEGETREAYKELTV